MSSVAGARSQVASTDIALTYDDGPHPDVTPAILDVLKAGGVTATFFVLGKRAEEHPDIIRRMIVEGHTVGSHSMTHPDFRVAKFSSVRADVTSSRAVIASIIGTPVCLFRPPHGHLTIRTAVMLRRAGARTWLWTVDSYDWKTGVTPEQVVSAVGGASGGDVVLLHDTNVHTIEATRALILHFRSRDMAINAIPQT